MLMLWEYIAEAVGCYINVSHETQFLVDLTFFEVIVNFFFKGEESAVFFSASYFILSVYIKESDAAVG